MFPIRYTPISDQEIIQQALVRWLLSYDPSAVLVNVFAGNVHVEEP